MAVTSTTFSVDFASSLDSTSVDTILPGWCGLMWTWPGLEAQALSPPPAYVRYPHDALLDHVAISTFNAEPWDLQHRAADVVDGGGA